MTHPIESQIEQAVEAMARALYELNNPFGTGSMKEYHEDARAALSAALPYLTAPAPEASGLQPIETAPKDNKAEIDLWADNIRYPNCHYHCGQWLFWDYRGVDVEPTWSEVKNPTHWMSIPAPPQGAVAPPPGPDERRRILDLPTGSVVHMTEQNAYLLCRMTQEGWLRELPFDGAKTVWHVRIRSGRRKEPEQHENAATLAAAGGFKTTEEFFHAHGKLTRAELEAQLTAALALIRKMQEVLDDTQSTMIDVRHTLFEAESASIRHQFNMVINAARITIDEASAFLKEQEGE